MPIPVDLPIDDVRTDDAVERDSGPDGALQITYDGGPLGGSCATSLECPIGVPCISGTCASCCDGNACPGGQMCTDRCDCELDPSLGDAGLVGRGDSGPFGPDAGTIGLDAGTIGVDAGTIGVDAGLLDAGAPAATSGAWSPPGSAAPSS